jgi:two-component system CheB/CheR fusion protein
MKPKRRKTPEKRHAPPKPAARRPSSRVLTLRHSDSPTPPFPVVGIGASAGGLEAFTALLKHLPLDTGLGFVLVQHLDPLHESALTQILARATSMPVREVTNNLPVRPNHVYIIPPNTDLGIARGVLKLQPRRQAGGAHRSIDSFFEALARDARHRAIGVILSGTATDGTLGLEAIKAEGGITFAQDESAKYDSMPRNAIAAGCVDFVLSPENIARELARIAKHPYVADPGDNPATSELPELDQLAPLSTGAAKPDGFGKILLLLRHHSGVDFTLYKPTTIRRRITRRMMLKKMASLNSYAALLRGDAGERDALYSDLLINVTSFFRNPEAFDFLKRKVFPRLVRDRPNDPVRAWVLGCSTGQEAYSLAMALQESIDNLTPAPKIRIFATDLNPVVLDKARDGLYPRAVVADVSPQRLRRFFVEEQGGYRISKSLRQMIVFAPQNLLSDPPFSRMDLVTCRNLLIYLEPALQKRAVPAFHYALKPAGFLFLGASESISGYSNLFAPVDKKNRIYSRKPGPTPALRLEFAPRDSARKNDSPPRAPLPAPEGLSPELNTEREADRVTVSRHAPPSLLVNADLEVLQFRGETGPYLKSPAGRASFSLLKMVREGLLLPLRAALNQAKKQNKVVRRENIRVAQNGQTRLANLEVVPLKNLKERCYLVFFEEAHPSSVASEPATLSPSPRFHALHVPAAFRRRISDLESDLAAKDEYLQSVQEQYEAANEELQASSEEVTSANEELQSLNEELETSKEELESANEELITINDEMASRNNELGRLNSDLHNLHASVNLAIVVFARDLAIRSFTPVAEKLFNLLAADIGRPLSGVRHNLDLPDLEQVLKEVIDTVSVRERQVRDKEGRWFALRARPYLSLDNKIDGVVLVLVDIDALKRTEQAITEARRHAEAVIRTVADPLLVLTSELRVHSANEAFYKTFQLSAAETEGRLIFELDQGSWDIPRLRSLLRDIIPRNSFFNEFELAHDFHRIGRRSLLLNARMLTDPSGASPQILLGIHDMTEVLAFQSEFRRSELRYRSLFEAARDGVLILDPKTRKILDANPFITELLGYSREELRGRELFEVGLLKDEAANRAAFRELQEKGFIRYENLPLETKAGRRREVEFISNLYHEDGERIIQCNIRDITARKQAEEAMRQSHADLLSHAEELDRFNRVAVGRELRMIELKREVNELCRRQGQPPAYPLEFEQMGLGKAPPV